MTTTTMIPLSMVDLHGPAQDAYGRRINYLRISLTDRCNLRCVYCMPAEGVRWQSKEELLSDDELLRVVRLAADVGFTKIRLTGGEPTLRRNLPDLVREIAANPAITDIAMTTNGILLSRLAEPLAAAGLKRINVSIDTLDPERFKQITRGGRLDLVMEGIAAAEAAGLTPIKLNAVVIRGQNDHEVADLAGLAYEHPWQMRFIEVMPFEGVDDVAFDLPRADRRGDGAHRGALGHPNARPARRPGRPGPPLRLPERARLGRLHLGDDRRLLRDLQPDAPDRRRQAAPLPAARQRGRLCSPSSAPARRTTTSASGCARPSGRSRGATASPPAKSPSIAACPASVAREVASNE